MDAGLDGLTALVAQSISRRAFITSLISELSPGEARRIFDSLSRRFLHVDLVGNLPIELVALVFKHLDPRATFGLQRVSKTWRAVLSSESVQKPCLWHFYPTDYPPLTGELDLSWGQRLALRAKHHLAVETRRPFTWALHPVESESPFSEPDQFDGVWKNDCYNGLFAWIPQMGDEYRECVRKFDLRNGLQQKLRAPDRSKINLVRVMAGHIAFVTISGAAYALRLHDNTMLHQRLENSNIESIGGREQYLCMAWFKRRYRRSLWVWDLHQDMAKSWELDDLDHPILSKTSLSISKDGQLLAILRTGPLEGYLSLTIYSVASGEEKRSSTFAWSTNLMRFAAFDFESGAVLPDVFRQAELLGLDRAVQTFFKRRAEFRDPMSGDLRVFSAAHLLRSHEEVDQISWGTSRLTLSIVPLHPEMVWPRGYGAYYLFCVASFDRNLELSGGDKSLVIEDGLTHKYA